MNKKIMQELKYELKYAEKKHPKQLLNVETWIEKILEKINKYKYNMASWERMAACTSGGGFDECGEGLNVMFAVAAMALRAIKTNEPFVRYFSRHKYFKKHKIRLLKKHLREIISHEKRMKKRERCAY